MPSPGINTFSCNKFTTLESSWKYMIIWFIWYNALHMRPLPPKVLLLIRPLPLKGQSPYQTRFQINWESKILLISCLQERPSLL
jgi:hypothetical protein